MKKGTTWPSQVRCHYTIKFFYGKLSNLRGFCVYKPRRQASFNHLHPRLHFCCVCPLIRRHIIQTAEFIDFAGQFHILNFRRRFHTMAIVKFYIYYSFYFPFFPFQWDQPTKYQQVFKYYLNYGVRYLSI